jgi:hypothetical protein
METWGMKRVDLLRLLALIGLVGMAGGCLGPRGLTATRLRYREAVRETNDQQWLLNLVQLRYGESPSFLDVAAINSQLELSTRGFVLGGQERDSLNGSSVGSAELQFRDAPTLSYAPKSESELNRALLAPLAPLAVQRMIEAGWRVDDVFRLMISEVNGVVNSRHADALDPIAPPEPTAFPFLLEAVRQLGAMGAMDVVAVDQTEPVSGPIAAERVDGADLVAAARDNRLFEPSTAGGSQLLLGERQTQYLLRIDPRFAQTAEARAVFEILKLDPTRSGYRLNIGEPTVPTPDGLELPPRGSIQVKIRTIQEMMIFLSKGVRVPVGHMEQGLVATTPGADGVLYDWTEVTTGLFRVCVQKKPPRDAAVAVRYRGHWFFIPDGDFRSKSTFALIQALFNIELTEPSRAGPLLTLPVGL